MSARGMNGGVYQRSTELLMIDLEDLAGATREAMEYLTAALLEVRRWKKEVQGVASLVAEKVDEDLSGEFVECHSCYDSTVADILDALTLSEIVTEKLGELMSYGEVQAVATAAE